MHTAPRKMNDAFSPAAEFTAGKASAATAPPIGIAVWRTPSASPRCPAENHCMTARPLAAFTLAPSAPASVRSATSSQNEPAQPAAATTTPHPARPLARTMRSPIRSESSPQGRSVAIGPIQTLENAMPTSLKDSP